MRTKSSATPAQWLAHVRCLRATVIRLDLPHPVEFDAATDEQLAEEYNGIGSDKYRALLGITTAVFHVFEAAALVHDFGWSKLWNDGTRARFEQSNNRFRAGNLILASTCHVWFGWLRPQQRAIYRAAGDALYRVVASDIGWDCWKAGAAEHEPGPEVI